MLTALIHGATIALALSASPGAALPEVAAGRIERVEGIDFGALPPRAVHVWRPEGLSADQRLAVLYMHDGQMLFDAGSTWNGQEWRVDETASALIAAGRTRPFMVVAIDNGGERRYSEYFPQAALDRLPAARREQLLGAGEASDRLRFAAAPASDAYLRFLVESLKPLIDSRYPTLPDPDNTLLMGSSMGGLISLYALSRHPEVFGAAACLSTHWPGGGDLEDPSLADALFAEFSAILPPTGRHRLYFDYGDATLDAAYPPLQARIDGLLRDKGYDEGNWSTRFFPGAEHSEQAWAERLDQPLRFLLPPVFPSASPAPP